MHGRTLRRAFGTLAGTTAAAVAATVALPLTTASAAERPPFYEPPATLPAADGDVIRAEPSVYYLDPLKTLKVDANVQRVMYRSTDGQGAPIAVTGTVITPKSAWSGPGERPVIGYAAGTQGLGDQCAPSRQLANGTEYEGLFVKGLLARGYGVAMTDYEGLGTPGLHTYMNRAVQGHAVLDSVRAAQRLPAAGLPDDGPVAVYGYSQGGGAAASAAELARSYAPDLDVRGVAAGAVPADLAAVGRNLDGSLYAAFLGFAVAGLAEGSDVDLGPYLNDRGRQVMAEAAETCTAEAVLRYPFLQSKTLTADGRPITDHMDASPWREVVAEQRIGARKPEVPVFVSHSMLDDVIPYGVGKKLVAEWCAKGATVDFSTNVAPTHVGGAVASYPAAYGWLEGRLAGKPAPDNC
ncbi:lipase [Streptomyces sp. CNQ-509]|uniref:lipase family protein n=1 Tax=unclassified Streptomyces TaxID=2593676 RepID=UPI00062DECDC|nr:lipase family protein [Streptomyces sp. CNQ-509]AKH83589.1 lipase [Streptomyces sp. CNQ-509]